MSVDRRGDGFDDPFTDPVILGHVADHLFVLFGETDRRVQVFLLVDVVGFEYGGEDGEAVFGVQRGIKVVPVDTRDFLSNSQYRPPGISRDLRSPLLAWQRRSDPRAG